MLNKYFYQKWTKKGQKAANINEFTKFW